MSGAPTLAELAGTELGSSSASYDDTAAILYALAVGASPDELGLVYERDMTAALPTYACALGLWAVEAAGRLGAYDPKRSLHASQRLVVHRPLPVSGEIAMTGRIVEVLDKGKAALVQIQVDSPYFTATYDIFLPGMGGWGGERGPSAAAGEPVEFSEHSEFATRQDLAVLYRLTGDRHPVHIDPDLARDNGFDRPILHGLCTLGIAARVIADHVGSDPTDLVELQARLAAPVLPGDTIEVVSGRVGDEVHFEARVGETAVLRGGRARFGASE